MALCDSISLRLCGFASTVFVSRQDAKTLRFYFFMALCDSISLQKKTPFRDTTEQSFKKLLKMIT